MTRPLWEKSSKYEYKLVTIGAGGTYVDIKATHLELFGGANSKMAGVPNLRWVVKLTTSAAITLKYNDSTNDIITITATESPYVESDIAISNLFIASAAGATVGILLKYI